MTDLALADNPRAVIGGNAPPLTPFEAVTQEIENLYDEAKLWLDGATVDSQELADGIGNLLRMIQAAEKKADELRKAEKKVLDDQVAEIQARYAPLIADTKAVKGKTVKAAAACKAALQPWLDKLAAEQAEAARIAREAAQKAAQEAQEAMRARDAANLAEVAQAEELVDVAKAAAKTATKAAKATPNAGTVGRAIGLRTVYIATITNARDFARWVWTDHYDEIAQYLPGIADRLATQLKHDMPGCTVTEQKKAV